MLRGLIVYHLGSKSEGFENIRSLSNSTIKVDFAPSVHLLHYRRKGVNLVNDEIKDIGNDIKSAK